MEVAPLHRTVDIRQKRRLLKNTKETKNILEGKSGGERRANISLRACGAKDVTKQAATKCYRLLKTTIDLHRLPQTAKTATE